LNKEIITKESQVKQDLRILAQKDRVLAQIARYSSFLGSMGSQEEEIVSALKEIENLANKSSIYLVDLKPAGQKIFGASKGYMIALNCEAQMEQIAEFIYNIQSSNRLFVVEKIQISPKSKDSSVAKCSLSIAKVILP
jgi:Tfp pilus assembly protein PilO